jgi:hypothetical protein
MDNPCSEPEVVSGGGSRERLLSCDVCDKVDKKLYEE